jgi:hypothetical protein
MQMVPTRRGVRDNARAMRSRSAALAALAALAGSTAALLGVVSAQAQPPQTIATEPFVSKISSYGGVLVWSHWDPSARTFRLSARLQGQITILPIGPRTIPFDVDLGPDPHGGTVAVYSRCSHEQPAWVLGVTSSSVRAPSGCSLYRYDFATQRELRISGIVGAGSASFYLPTLWKNEIAYVRSRGSGAPALYAQPLSVRRGHRTVALALPNGPAGSPGPVALDLRGGELAFAWDDGERDQFDSGIYVDSVPSTPRAAPTQDVLDAESSATGSPGLIGFPALAAAGLFYGRFDGSAIVPLEDEFDRIATDGGGAALAAAPHALRAQTRDGNTTYAMYGPYTGSFSNCGAAGCALVAIDGISYQ